MDRDNAPAAAEVDAAQRDGAAAEAVTLWQDAIDAYERALSSGGAVDEAAILTALGRCYWNIADARTAWRTLRRAISQYQERGDSLGQARATLEILRIWGPRERHKQMADDALVALADNDPVLRARLLLRSRWYYEDEANDVYAQAMALAEQHHIEDVLAARIERGAWDAMNAGHLDEGVALFVEAHDEFARLHLYDVAAGVLRNAAFNTIEAGLLDDGFALAERAFAYSSGVHLSFQAQLALMDMVGIAFARDEYEGCEALLARVPGASDFRGDLYRMWMAERNGDTDGALRLMVSPDRGGNATTAMGQIHASAAGVLYRSGRSDAALEAMRAWLAVERPWADDLLYEAPALTECILGLGDDEVIRRIDAAITASDARTQAPPTFTTLQGRALAPLRAGIALRVGRIDDAERIYRAGVAFCDEQRLPHDAALCRAGVIATEAARA